MISLLFYLTSILGDDAPPEAPEGGTIGFAIPSFSTSGGICYKLIFFFECLSFVSFVLFPKRNLAGFQTQAVIFQGMLIGVDHVLTTSAFGFGGFLFFYIALFSAPAAAILSVNDKFRNLFLSLINAYGTTYLLCILIRLSYFYSVVVGIILYFVFLLMIKKYEVLETCMGKIYTVTLSTIVLVDIWGYWSILKSLHGASNSTTSFIIAIILALGILAVVSALVILPTYYMAWTAKKLGKNFVGGEPPKEEAQEAPKEEAG
jgi:hypothetical protein